MLRQREHDVDGLQRGDDGQGGGIGAVHDIALIHLAYAGAAGNRYRNRRVAEVGARAIDLCLVLLHLRLQLRDQRALRVGLLCRGILRLREFVVARQIQFRIAQIGRVLRLLRHRLIIGRLIGSGIDLREHVACLHVLPLAKPHGDKRPVHHRLDADRIERLHRSDPIHIHRHIGDHGARDQNRHLGRFLRVLRRVARRLLVPAPDYQAADDRECDHQDKKETFHPGRS